MTKVILSTFALLFAIGGAIATNVSNSASLISTRVALTISNCVTIGTCTVVGSNPPVCVTIMNGINTLVTTSSGCTVQALGQFRPL